MGESSLSQQSVKYLIPLSPRFCKTRKTIWGGAHTAWVEGFGVTSGTGIPGRFGTGRIKPSGAGGCRFSTILPSGIHGGREEGNGRAASSDLEQRCVHRKARAWHFPATR